MVIANRSVERGRTLARRFVADNMPLAELPTRLAEFDVVVSCTASTLPIIGLGMVERAVKARRHRPMFMVDLAVPRDIEEEVGELDDVFLYTVDDLALIVEIEADALRINAPVLGRRIGVLHGCFRGWTLHDGRQFLVNRGRLLAGGVVEWTRCRLRAGLYFGGALGNIRYGREMRVDSLHRTVGLSRRTCSKNVLGKLARIG